MSAVWATVVEVLSWALVLSGSGFVLVGALGLVRMPDFYTRMHASSVIETLGAGLLVFGMILQAGFTLISFKLLVVLALFFFISPVSAHAMAQTALHEKLAPHLKSDRRGRLRGDGSSTPGASARAPSAAATGSPSEGAS